MTAKTPTERQKAHAERKRAAGLREVRSLWAHPDDHAKLRALNADMLSARAMKAKHAKESK